MRGEIELEAEGEGVGSGGGRAMQTQREAEWNLAGRSWVSNNVIMCHVFVHHRIVMLSITLGDAADISCWVLKFSIVSVPGESRWRDVREEEREEEEVPKYPLVSSPEELRVLSGRKGPEGASWAADRAAGRPWFELFEPKFAASATRHYQSPGRSGQRYDPSRRLP